MSKRNYVVCKTIIGWYIYEMSNNLLSTNEVAVKLGVTPIRVRAMIRAGRLPAQKIGRDYVVREPDLRLVENRKSGRPHKEKPTK